jgi:uncharacterized membrane protein
MPVSRQKHGSPAAAACLLFSGVLFVLYPAIRPFSDEVTLQGAKAFASGAWIAAHMLAVVGFILLALGLLGLCLRFQGEPVYNLLLRALVVCWVGIGLTLPFYGAEVFGLHAIGLRALHQQNVSLVGLANDVRTGPGLPIFVIGLLVLAAGTVMVSVAVWRARTMTKWSGIPLAVGFLLFLPQFAAGQMIRVAHGVVIAWGCIWLASYLWRRPSVGGD